MSQFFGGGQTIPNITGGPATNGAWDNHQVVVSGAGGGTMADLAQLIALANGPSQNGGNNQNMFGNPSFGGMYRQSAFMAYLPWILVGSVVLWLVVKKL